MWWTDGRKSPTADPMRPLLFPIPFAICRQQCKSPDKSRFNCLCAPHDAIQSGLRTCYHNLPRYGQIGPFSPSRFLALTYDLPIQWRHNGCDGVTNHQPRDCLLNRLFRRRSKKTSKLRVTGLCAGNSPMTGEFAAQRASNAKNVSIW